MSATGEQAKHYDIFSTENMFKYVDVAVLAFSDFSFVLCFDTTVAVFMIHSSINLGRVHTHKHLLKKTFGIVGPSTVAELVRTSLADTTNIDILA